jgi:hypothetical protein
MLCSEDVWNGEELNLDSPLSCFVNPNLWNITEFQLEDGRTRFNQNDGTQDYLDLLFSDYTEGQVQYETKLLIEALNATEKVDFITRYSSKLQYDGDMAGSGAATDPLFWVAHGAVERLYQRFVMKGLPSDLIYGDVNEDCSGHASNGTKAWLEGFYFEDESVYAHQLTNSELTSILAPTSDDYHLMIPFIYDHSNWGSFCQWEDFFQL